MKTLDYGEPEAIIEDFVTAMNEANFDVIENYVDLNGYVAYLVTDNYYNDIENGGYTYDDIYKFITAIANGEENIDVNYSEICEIFELDTSDFKDDQEQFEKITDSLMLAIETTLAPKWYSFTVEDIEELEYEDPVYSDFIKKYNFKYEMMQNIGDESEVISSGEETAYFIEIDGEYYIIGINFLLK